jgi:ABC-type multidrug transport system fused ATPase/permease subunit
MASSSILTLEPPPAAAHNVEQAVASAPADQPVSPFRTHRLRITITYLLFNVENIARLAQPWFLGWAVNDLLAGRCLGLMLCVAQYLLSTALCVLRQLCDTRTFTRLYADLATNLVVKQRRGGVDLSRLAARSSLARELVDFFERDVPFLFHAVYSVVGALVMIALFDVVLILPSLLFMAVTGLLLRSLGRRTLKLNRGLNDEIEREVGVLQTGAPERVEHHYYQLRGWRIRLSNAQALNFGVTEALALVLMAFVLVRGCADGATNPGSLFAILGYVVMLTTSLVNLPQWIQQLSRLRDIRRRLLHDKDAA